MKTSNRLAIFAMLVLLAVIGCGPKEGVSNRPGHHDKHEEDPAPHGGTLFAVPGHTYHGELVVDAKGKQATVYIFDGNVRKTVPTNSETITVTIKDATPVRFELKPQPQEGDPKDASSRFVGAHDRLGSAVDYEKVELSGLIAGKQYIFTLDK